MTEKEIKELLQDIQDDLEKLKDLGVDVLFLASKNNRGVISGSMEGIVAMLLFNMIRYPQFRAIMEATIKNYPSFAQKFGSDILNDAPAHEIIDNYGQQLEYIIVEKKGGEV